MATRRSLTLAAVIAALALLIALWAWRGGDERSADGRGSIAEHLVNGQSLLENRPLPTAARVSEGGSEPSAPGVPGAGPSNDQPGKTEVTSEVRARLARREQLLARQAALAAGADPRLAAADAALDDHGRESALGGPPEAAPPTAVPGSIYDGLSNDDLLELLVAMRRLRDAGVFVKLTPDEFHNVAQLLPDALGVKDADGITQRILGMPVGEWLDHERGPEGRFVMQ